MKKQDIINELEKICKSNDNQIMLHPQCRFSNDSGIEFVAVLFDGDVLSAGVDKGDGFPNRYGQKETIFAEFLTTAELMTLLATVKKTINLCNLDDIANTARNRMIELIIDHCRDNKGKIKFHYYKEIIDDCDGEIYPTEYTGATIDDGKLYFITPDNGEDDAVLLSMDELYNITLNIFSK